MDEEQADSASSSVAVASSSAVSSAATTASSSAAADSSAIDSAAAKSSEAAKATCSAAAASAVCSSPTAASRSRAPIHKSCDDASVGVLQRAFLTQLQDDGSTSCVASGEYRPDEGVFAVQSVIMGHESIDVAGIPLGDMVNHMIVLEDLDDGDLEVEWEDFDDAGGGEAV